MGEIHYFDIDIAKKYGINCAVILNNLWYWIRKNEANGKHYHDGRYWTYNSTRAFSELFPYLSQKQIETSITKLRDEGIILIGNYNDLKYDRTRWYSISEKGKCILLGGKMEITSESNGFHQEVKPIPYINTDNKPNINTYMFEDFWNAYPKKKAKEAARKAWYKLKPDKELANRIIETVKAESITNDWIKDKGKYIPYPATYINGKRWEDEETVSTRTETHDPNEDLGDLLYREGL